MADRIVLDDPGYSSAAWPSWWEQTLRPGSTKVVVIMARLHHDDITGTVLSSDLGYDYLVIPPEK